MKRFTLATLLFGALSTGLAFGASDPVLKQVKELMQAKNYQRAIAMITTELRSKPQEYQLWLAMGYCHEGLQQTNEALEAFKRARTLNAKIPGIDNRINSIEKILKIGQAKKEDEHLTPEQKKGKELFAKVIKDKTYGRFDDAFGAFPACVDLNPEYLNGNDEGVIVAGLNYFQEKLERNDQSALFPHSVYLYFKGDFFNSEQGLYKFIEMKPAPEMIEKAQTYLKLIAERREAQSNALVKAPPQKDPDKTPIKTIDKAGKTTVASPSQPPSSPSTASSAVQPIEVMAGVPSDSDREALERSIKADRDMAARQAEVLIKEYSSANADRQKQIILDIGNLRAGSAEALGFLEGSLESKDYLTYAFSLEALRKIGPDAAPLAPHIIKSLDGVADLRVMNALNTLGRIQASDEETLSFLAKNLNSGKDNLQDVSFKSLVRIGEPAVPFLIEQKNKALDESGQKTLARIISQIKGISLDEALKL